MQCMHFNDVGFKELMSDQLFSKSIIQRDYKEFTIESFLTNGCQNFEEMPQSPRVSGFGIINRETQIDNPHSDTKCTLHYYMERQ